MRPTSLEVMFSRSWNVMMLRNLALIKHSVLSRSVGLRTRGQHSSVKLSKIQQNRTEAKTERQMRRDKSSSISQPSTEHRKLQRLSMWMNKRKTTNHKTNRRGTLVWPLDVKYVNRLGVCWLFFGYFVDYFRDWKTNIKAFKTDDGPNTTWNVIHVKSL